ncbi:uncharacterized protein LOC119672148 [Teleopsis dalmanni]|uniref:uncharacterized protein LOC119672148 n=1 Tax=Teleopsis dalmanni TaxID=139649 RepID=UPI0018CE348A|nr:uncharacterized protein LOC119672148 [Teleopsis dalmanni]XP_037939054.1 uncharacterized protein LOC119672148 [Teleopsis dalmanni]XP_037939055.1 uncharacterized protein LOC119672148 [Teleopsis dalmanni]
MGQRQSANTHNLDSKPCPKRHNLEEKPEKIKFSMLPDDILYTIFDHLTYKDLLNVRASSKRLLECSADYIKHCCLKMERIKNNKLFDESNAAIKLATQMFVKYGFEDSFYIQYHSYLNKSIADVSGFLYNFYNCVYSINHGNQLKMKSLFTMNVLLIIMQFNNIIIQKPISLRRIWRVSIKRTGAWVGLWSLSRDDIDKCCDFIALIFEALKFYNPRLEIREVHNNNWIHTPIDVKVETIITLKVHGGREIRSLLESIIFQKNFDPTIQKLTGCEFKVYLDISYQRIKGSQQKT